MRTLRIGSSQAFIVLIAAALSSSWALAQEATFTLSTYPPAKVKPDGTREISPNANIAGVWQTQSGARYSCSQVGPAFACVVDKTGEDQARAGVQTGDVLLSGVIYEHVAISTLVSGFAPSARCPAGYRRYLSLNLRISDDSKTMRGELVIPHVSDNCTQDGATIQEAVLRRVDS